MNKYNIHKSIKAVDHHYKVRDKFKVNNNSTFKYETQYKEPFDITHFWNNDMTALQRGAKNKLGQIYVALKHMHLIQTLRVLFLRTTMMKSNLNIPVVYFYLFIKYWKKKLIRCAWEN